MAGRKMELVSMTCLGDNVMEKLKQYAQEDVVFIKENKSADAVLVYQFCREFMDWYYQCLKERQKIGIQNALKRKREGNGVYGRPRVQIPEDFEVNIRACLDSKRPLGEYCMNIGMALSTFYKYSYPIRKQWKDEQRQQQDIYTDEIENKQAG